MKDRRIAMRTCFDLTGGILLMWQLPTPFRKRIDTRRTPVRRPRRYRPHCKLLEERCLLSVTLTPSGPSVPLVGSPVTWTATASGDGTTPVYQFNVEPPGGTFQVVQDYSGSNSFTWNPMQQGTFNIEVIVKDSYSATTGDSTSASYTAQSRVVGNTAVISAMSNPLVALYSAPPSPGSSMYVQFAQLGPNPSWQNTSPEAIVPGESTNFIVAGMLPNTTYLMRDVLSDGTASTPLAFTTGSLPSYLTFPNFTVPGPPAPGTDLSQNMIFHMGVSAAKSIFVDTVATDLNGNVEWYYDQVANSFPSFAVNTVSGGTVLLLGGQVRGGADADTLREVDMAGDLVRETSINAVNAELAAMGVNTITDFTHDAVRLPNGDTAVLALDDKVIDVNGTPTTYVGDEVLVLDKNFQVTWAWDAFDWLSTSRLPTLGEGPGDWLHANSVNWSPEDGDLIVSLRSQDWVLKIDYDNGSGDGHIVWTLGQDGSFTVIAPPGTQYPWFSHQHDATYINDTTIVLFDDGNVRQANDPTADSRGQEWVLNEQNMTATLVVNADLGNYSTALGSAQMLPNGNLDFNSGFLGTAPNNFGDSIQVLPDGTITYVQTMSGLEYRSYFMSTLYGTAANILDQGFEYPMLGSGQSAYQYDPTASSWSFSGSAGLAGNGSAFTSGNPNAPQAEQVAFIQNSGVIGQAVDFAEAGTYQLSVSAAQRGNHSGSSDEEVDVLVDGTVVGTINPASTSYATYTTGSFSVTAGSHIIKFVGIDPSGADYTALLDQVNIVNVAPTGFSDPGFESPSQRSGESAYAYDPKGSTWSFSGGAGLAGNGSAFTAGNPDAPQGSQVAFIQRTGTASQVVVFPSASAGSYQITLSAAQRGNHSGGAMKRSR